MLSYEMKEMQMGRRIGRWIALLAVLDAAATMAGGVDFPHGAEWGRLFAARWLRGDVRGAAKLVQGRED